MFSKSQYLTAKQCHKALWLHENRPDVLSGEMKSGVMENGRLVGEYARELFPNNL